MASLEEQANEVASQTLGRYSTKRHDEKLILAFAEQVRAEALREAVNAADQLPERRPMGSDRWTAYVQSRRDAVAAIRALIDAPLSDSPADVTQALAEGE